MNILTVIGILTVAAAGVACLLMLCVAVRAWLYGRRTLDIPEEASEQQQDLPEPAIGDDAYRAILEWVVGNCHQTYLEKRRALPIPERTLTVQIVASVFALDHVPLAFDCWDDRENLYLFPQWESIWAHLTDPEKMYALSREQGSGPHMLWLAKEDIVRCQFSADGQWIALYSREGGRVLLAGDEVEDIPPMLQPRQDQETRQGYLRSQQNIRDIHQELERLRRQHEQGQISDEAYQQGQYAIVSKY